MDLITGIAAFWSRLPSGRRLAMSVGILATYFVVENLGATLIAGAVGYRGSIGTIFTLSMTFAYSPARAGSTVAALGESGRAADALTLIAFDLVFPLVYATCLSFGLRFVTFRLALPRRAIVLSGLFPLAAAVANWMADGAIIGLILAYPATHVAFAVAASALTTVKLTVIAVSAIGTLLGLAALVVRPLAGGRLPDREALRPPASWKERGLIACGIAGPVLFNIVYLLEGAFRPGYDALRMPISALSLTSDGWMQVANFVGFGVLICGFALGLRALLAPGPARIWAPALQLLTAIGLIATGVFVQDPGQGYPVGVAQPMIPTLHGSIHLIATVIAFNARLLWMIVMAFRFRTDRLWRGFSPALFVAVVVLIAFLGAFGAALSSGGLAGLFERLATVCASILSVAIATRIMWLEPRRPSSEVQPARVDVADELKEVA